MSGITHLIEVPSRETLSFFCYDDFSVSAAFLILFETAPKWIPKYNLQRRVSFKKLACVGLFFVGSVFTFFLVHISIINHSQPLNLISPFVPSLNICAYNTLIFESCGPLFLI